MSPSSPPNHYSASQDQRHEQVHRADHRAGHDQAGETPVDAHSHQRDEDEQDNPVEREDNPAAVHTGPRCTSRSIGLLNQRLAQNCRQPMRAPGRGAGGAVGSAPGQRRS